MSARYQQILAEDRRLVLLRALQTAPGSTCNAYVLHRSLEDQAHALTLAEVKDELQWLAQNKLVALVEDPPVIVATLTQLGLYVAQGKRVMAGVKAPLLGD